MAGGKTVLCSNKVIDHFMGKASTTMPASVYLALATTAPTSATTGASVVEATYTTYARTAIPAASLSAASSGSDSNTSAITFPAVTASSSTIIGFITVDSSSGAGNAFYFGSITSKTVDTANTPPTVGIGALIITEA